MSEINRQFGYLYGQDDLEGIDQNGIEPELVLQAARSAYPDFNPYAPAWLNWQDQKNQGSCQGHSLAMAFQVAAVQRYGVQLVFSRAGAYYLSQKADGITGDRGSTLKGGQTVASEGLCLEKEWPYPSRYRPQMPSTAIGKLDFKMPGSKRVTDPQLAWDLLAAGCCIQTGVKWGNDFEREVCDEYTGRGAGGHSTLLYGLDQATGNAWNVNSWGNWFPPHCRNQWTQRFFRQIIERDRYAVFVAYDSTSLIVPDNLYEMIGSP